MRLLIYAALLVLTGCGGSGSENSNAPTGSSGNSQISFPSAPDTIDYDTIKDLPFTSPSATRFYGNAPEQFVDYWPSTGANKNTNVIIIHGGCWLSAFDITQSYPMATALSQDGYTVWSVEYRRAGNTGGGWPNTLNDVKSALTFISEQSETLPQDRTIVAGHSAGGHLALMATADSQSVDAVIGLAAIYDIEVYAGLPGGCPGGIRELLEGSPADQPLLYMDANPAQNSLHPSVFLLHGDDDDAVPVTQATNSGLPHRIQPDGQHFDWLHPRTASFDTLKVQLQN